MPRPRSNLDKTYGLLTVVEDPGGSLKTLVRCVCGTEKWVLRSNLTSHRVSSCGSATCRTRKTTPPPPLSEAAKKSLRIPSWLPERDVAKMVKQVDAGGKVMVIATNYGVHIQTVYNLLRTIKAAGGVEEYLAACRREPSPHAAPVPPTTHAPAPAGLMEPGVLPAAPPALYRP
jgi:hypothetical protein